MDPKSAHQDETSSDSPESDVVLFHTNRINSNYINENCHIDAHSRESKPLNVMNNPAFH